MSGYTYKESLELLNKDKWCQLSIEKKVEALQAVETEMAIRGKRLPCEVTAVNLHSEKGIYLGAYSPSGKDIKINSEQLQSNSKYGNDYSTHLDTVLHEGRHAYQDQVVNGYIRHENSQEVQSWRDNMKDGHYITYEKNPRAYFNQPIERDARSFASKATERIEAEKVQLQREKLARQYEQPKITNSNLDEKRQRYIEDLKKNSEKSLNEQNKNGYGRDEKLKSNEANSKSNGIKR